MSTSPSEEPAGWREGNFWVCSVLTLNSTPVQPFQSGVWIYYLNAYCFVDWRQTPPSSPQCLQPTVNRTSKLSFRFLKFVQSSAQADFFLLYYTYIYIHHPGEQHIHKRCFPMSTYKWQRKTSRPHIWEAGTMKCWLMTKTINRSSNSCWLIFSFVFKHKTKGPND